MVVKALEGRVALVAGGGEGIGRASALALSARGARIVVLGPDERRLGETVGEIVYGGGKARHVVGDPARPEDVRAALDRARDVFGPVDLVIATQMEPGPRSQAMPSGLPLDPGLAEACHEDGLLGALCTFMTVLGALEKAGRFVVVAREGASLDRSVRPLVRRIQADGSPRGIHCDAVLLREVEGGRAAAWEEESTATRIADLCSRDAPTLAGT